jgi:hypothetical protein
MKEVVLPTTMQESLKLGYRSKCNWKKYVTYILFLINLLLAIIIILTFLKVI